ARGQEMGWFEHGSTIVVISPRSLALAGEIVVGEEIRMGQALWRQVPMSVTPSSHKQPKV
ncbi:MAG: Phosphatidylserine decarboxylase proenzyme, partial [Pseudomonadota bacterium]